MKRLMLLCLILCLLPLGSFAEGEDVVYATAVDIQVVAAKQALTYAAVDQQMRELAATGFTRVYFILCNPGYSMFSSPTSAPYRGGMLQLSHRLLDGDINAAYAAACKKAGMEAIAVIKPYEGGGSMSVPEGVTVENSLLHAASVGGNRVFFDDFTAAHPEMRVQRQADYAWETNGVSITGLTAAFMLDEFQNKTDGRGQVRTYTPASFSDITGREIYLWWSMDNGQYQRYEGPMDAAWTQGPLRLTDANGVTPLYEADSHCALLTITGLALPEGCKYLALGLSNGQGLYTIPSSMIRLTGAQGELPTSVTRWARYPRDLGDRPERHTWGMERQPESTTNLSSFLPMEDGSLLPLARDGATARAGEFTSWGFEYAWYGQGHSGDGWCAAPLYGIALGQDEYIAGLLCEVYPEVRAYWLDLVADALHDGYDGVDIRLAGHSSMALDYMCYGYNAPLVAAYLERYGEDVSQGVQTGAQYARLMALRGEYFQQFLTEAAALTHEQGKTFAVHLRQAYVDGPVSADWNQLCHWTAPKITLDWQSVLALCDEVTIKDYHYDTFDPALARTIMDAAKAQGKRVFVHCYIQQAGDLNETFLAAAAKDEAVGGIIFYELTASVSDYKKLLDRSADLIQALQGTKEE